MDKIIEKSYLKSSIISKMYTQNCTVEPKVYWAPIKNTWRHPYSEFRKTSKVFQTYFLEHVLNFLGFCKMFQIFLCMFLLCEFFQSILEKKVPKNTRKFYKILRKSCEHFSNFPENNIEKLKFYQTLTISGICSSIWLQKLFPFQLGVLFFPRLPFSCICHISRRKL